MQRALRANPIHRPLVQARGLTTVHQERPPLLFGKHTTQRIARKTKPSHVTDDNSENDGPKYYTKIIRINTGGSNNAGVDNHTPDNSAWFRGQDRDYFPEVLDVGHLRRHVIGDNLWLFYLEFKARHPDRLASLEREVWSFLFYHQCRAPIREDLRMKRLLQLHDDMESAGAKPSLVMRFAVIQSLVQSGGYNLALAIWKKCRVLKVATGMKQKYIEYLQLGVLLHIHLNKTYNAHRLAMDLYDYAPQHSEKVLMAMFTAHIRASSKQARGDLAYDVFVRMKDLPEQKAMKEDYLAWLEAFLTCGCPEYAMDVFKAMVQSRHLADGHDAKKEVESLSILKRICDSTKDSEGYSKTMLSAISVLPKAYHLGIYHHWMQQTAVQNTPEAAAQILELMFRQGLQPDSFHFNFLLRVLRRTGNPEYVAKTENIGWKMIERASDRVINSLAFMRPLFSQETTGNNSEKEGTDVEAGFPLEMTIPPADSDTFAILLEHHTKAAQWEHVDYLKKKLSTVNFQPTSPLMNTILNVSRWSGDYGEVFRQFYAWTQPSDGGTATIPDGASWRALWATMRLANVYDSTGEGLSSVNNYTTEGIPTPRELLSGCVKWWEFIKSQPRFDPNRFKIGLAGKDGGAIQKLIIHCFNNANDLPGQLVALHVLRKIFNLIPPSDTYEMLRFQIIKKGLVSAASARSTYVHSGLWEKNVERVDRVYHILMQRRFQRMNLTGDDFAALNLAEVADLNLKILSEFVRVVLVRKHPPGVVEAMIDEAKKEIGVPDLNTGDLDAFSVA
jgi:hypothetical protein